jgi:hypothetical protein
VDPAGIGQTRRILRETVTGIRHAATLIQDRRDTLHDLQHRQEGTRETDGTAAVQTQALDPIDDILRTLRGLEERITAMIAICDQTPSDQRSAEIARLKSEMMRDTTPSVPYLM